MIWYILGAAVFGNSVFLVCCFAAAERDPEGPHDE